MPKSEHLENRVREINEGVYDGAINELLQKSIKEIKNLYDSRDIEK